MQMTLESCKLVKYNFCPKLQQMELSVTLNHTESLYTAGECDGITDFLILKS